MKLINHPSPPVSGYEFSNQVDPFEAGIGFTVPLARKQDDFVGKSALARRKESPQRRFVGLELDSNEVASHGDSIRLGRAQIGVVTSGTRSPLLGRSIALGRIDIGYSNIDTIVEVGKIDGHQKLIPAKIVPTPFYDPEKRIPRGLE
jgi:aminomethyltransferase